MKLFRRWKAALAMGILDQRSTAESTCNLSEAHLVVGEIGSAIATAQGATEIAYRRGSSGKSGRSRIGRWRHWTSWTSWPRADLEIVHCCAIYAHALHMAGRIKEAEQLFAETERRQEEQQPENRLLYSLQGYYYCDLLLSKGDWASVRERAVQILGRAKLQQQLLDVGLGTLILGRTHLGLGLAARNHAANQRRDCAWTVQIRLDEAVDGLRAAGQLHHIPLCLLARAVFRRSVGDWSGAARDLDEVEEIAEPGPMKLYLCDMALERARLAFARIEAFAPLNGLLDTDKPPKPSTPSAEEIARLKTEAAKELKTAADYIATCGYHRRDDELAELEAVLASSRRFAGLPPRV